MENWINADINHDGVIREPEEFLAGIKNEISLPNPGAANLRGSLQSACSLGKGETTFMITETVAAKTVNSRIEKALATVGETPTAEDYVALAKLRIGPDLFDDQRGRLTETEIQALNDHVVYRLASVLQSHYESIAANPDLRNAIAKEYPVFELKHNPDPETTCATLGFRLKKVAERSV